MSLHEQWAVYDKIYSRKEEELVSFLLVSSVFGSEETSWDLSDQVTPKEGRIYQSDSSLGPIKFWLLFTVVVDICVLSFHNRLIHRHFFYPSFSVVGRHLDDGHTQIASNAERDQETCRDGNNKKMLVEMIPLANLAS